VCLRALLHSVERAGNSGDVVLREFPPQQLRGAPDPVQNQAEQKADAFQQALSEAQQTDSTGKKNGGDENEEQPLIGGR
jgi:hypothetical protein